VFDRAVRCCNVSGCADIKLTGVTQKESDILRESTRSTCN